MGMLSHRFGVGNPLAERSSEWAVLWKKNTSDVYICTRTLGGVLKASIHSSGCCHIRAPSPESWKSPGPPPKFLETWNVDPLGEFAFPFAVSIAASELRIGAWPLYRDKGTRWLPVDPGYAVEIAVFLTRTEKDLLDYLRENGWRTALVDSRLPDGRRLVVMEGVVPLLEERRIELDAHRLKLQRVLAAVKPVPSNPRALLVASDQKGTRRFVELAL